MLRLTFIYCEDPRRVGFVVATSNPDSKPRLDYSAVRNEIPACSRQGFAKLQIPPDTKPCFINYIYQ